MAFAPKLKLADSFYVYVKPAVVASRTPGVVG
jgi:hypothetical protein